MEGAKLDTFNYDEVSEVCVRLRKTGAVNEAVREKVLKVVDGRPRHQQELVCH